MKHTLQRISDAVRSKATKTVVSNCTVCDAAWDYVTTAEYHAKLHTLETGHKTSVETIKAYSYELKK